jgi:DNA processing protein
MKQPGEYSIAAQVWALCRFGEVGPRAFRALLAAFGSVEAVHQSELEGLTAIEGLGEDRSLRIFESSNYLNQAEEFINSLNLKEIGYCTSLDEVYPSLLEELNDPPPMILYQGELPQSNEKTVAIVGSQDATNEGISYAVDLAMLFARQSVSVVSGLACGTGASAHIGALRNGGRTYAVLGSGFDNITPQEHLPIAAEIVQNGGLISEYPPEAETTPDRLVERNRLVAGLSRAVVIGEVLPDSSEAIDTASFCHQLGKLMFIVIDGCEAPGRDNSWVEKIMAMGAIPFSLEDGIDDIVKSLV